MLPTSRKMRTTFLLFLSRALVTLYYQGFPEIARRLSLSQHPVVIVVAVAAAPAPTDDDDNDTVIVAIVVVVVVIFVVVFVNFFFLSYICFLICFFF